MSEASGGSIRSPAATLVIEEALGFVLSRAIYVAAKLGIADLLADEPLTADELAERSGAHGPSLARFLRTLASAGIFAQTDTGRFELNEPARLLRTDVDGSLRDLAVYYGELAYRGWEEALHAVRTGEPGFPRVFGAGFWDYLEQNPEAARTFHGAMRGGARTRALALRTHAWNGTETVVDLGGAVTARCSSNCSRTTQACGASSSTDRRAVATARTRIAEAGLEARCEARAGDLFSEIPTEGDVYALVIVLHDWDDDHAGAILRTCRQAMRDDSRLLIVEVVMSESSSPCLPQLLDLHMLVELGGRERSEPEWRALLEQSEFRLAGIRPAPPWSVLEAVPVPR